MRHLQGMKTNELLTVTSERETSLGYKLAATNCVDTEVESLVYLRNFRNVADYPLNHQ